MTQLSEVGQITEQLMKGVQPRCQECPTAKFSAMLRAEEFLKDQVLGGLVTIEEVALEHASDINNNCYGGQRLPSGEIRCWQGIHTPIQPQHLREDI